jgi:tripeptide aminopeptidase
MNNDLLKRVLSIQTMYGHEQNAVAFLLAHCAERGYRAVTDKYRNVYIRKGRLHQKGEKFPLVCAHIDTVHPMEEKVIQESNGILRAFSTEGQQIGIGGDCLAGVFICLELLEAFPKIKVAFFSGEEIGCKGSSHARARFFCNVGYGIEFDSPGNNTMSYSNSGVKNFHDNGAFINTALPSLDRYGITSWQRHPFTDVLKLRTRFGFACLNLAAGYYRMHSNSEYVVMEDVQNAILLGHELISSLGRKAYMEPVEPAVFGGNNPNAKREVIGCHFPDSPLWHPHGEYLHEVGERIKQAWQ